MGWLSDPFKGLSDLQLGDEKGTLNHLVSVLQFILYNLALNMLPQAHNLCSRAHQDPLSTGESVNFHVNPCHGLSTSPPREIRV